MAAQTRIVRSGMLDVLGSDYIRMGRSLGVPERALIWKYALRNAALPLVTMMGVYFASTLGGSFVVETIFAWPGLGRTVVEAVFSRDFPPSGSGNDGREMMICLACGHVSSLKFCSVRMLS